MVWLRRLRRLRRLQGSIVPGSLAGSRHGKRCRLYLLGQRQPDAHAHFGQHGTTARIDVQRHGSRPRSGRQKEEVRNRMKGLLSQRTGHQGRSSFSRRHITSACSRPPPTAG